MEYKEWDFSFDEVSYYDLEAMIDKVLNVTRQTHVYYVAHSEGCVLMLAKLSIDPIFSSKVFFYWHINELQIWKNLTYYALISCIKIIYGKQ